ncbi:hypothetical protein ILUMI_08762, partial [Ignelater luminosus]
MEPFVIAAGGVFCVTSVLCFCKAMKRGRLLVSLALKANNGEDDNVEAPAMPSLSDTGGISDISPCPDAFPINLDLLLPNKLMKTRILMIRLKRKLTIMNLIGTPAEEDDNKQSL